MDEDVEELIDKGRIPYESTLCQCSKISNVLLPEYAFEVGSRKAAKLFSSKKEEG